MPGLIENIESEWKDAKLSGYTTPGWYFWDEADSQCYGPFDSESIAEIQRDRYFKHLQEGPPKKDTTRDEKFGEMMIRLDRAVSERRKVRLSYLDRSATKTSRTVRPLALMVHGRSHWMLFTWCQLREAFRIFRVDRIISAEVLNFTFEPVPGQTVQDMLSNTPSAVMADLLLSEAGFDTHVNDARCPNWPPGDPMIKHVGNRTYRFKDNPLEKEFSKAWKADNERPNGGAGVLELSMGDGVRPGIIDQRDATLAASVVQWLGSPVGQHFLTEVLKTKAGKSVREELRKFDDQEE